MKWFTIGLLIVCLIIAAVFLYQRHLAAQSEKSLLISVGAKAVYRVEVRDTILGRAQGLSGRPELAQDAAMLFIFDQPTAQSFWMKDMQFPLDILWIRNFEVIGYEEHIPHPAANNGEIARMYSREPADMVLEINAGEIARTGIKIGDRVELTR